MHRIPHRIRAVETVFAATALLIVGALLVVVLSEVRPSHSTSITAAEAGRAAMTALEPPGIAASPDRLRVCADPNNLPYSNERGEGFENAIAEIVARDIGRDLSFVWYPQRREDRRRTGTVAEQLLVTDLRLR